MIRRRTSARSATPNRAIGIALAVALTFALVACGDTAPDVRPAPVAAAGPDRIVEVGASVVRDPVHLRAATLAALVFTVEELERVGH